MNLAPLYPIAAQGEAQRERAAALEELIRIVEAVESEFHAGYRFTNENLHLLTQRFYVAVEIAVQLAQCLGELLDILRQIAHAIQLGHELVDVLGSFLKRVEDQVSVASRQLDRPTGSRWAVRWYTFGISLVLGWWQVSTVELRDASNMPFVAETTEQGKFGQTAVVTFRLVEQPEFRRRAAGGIKLMM